MFKSERVGRPPMGWPSDGSSSPAEEYQVCGVEKLLVAQTLSEVPNSLWKPKVNYHVRITPPLVHILSQISPVHTTTCDISRIHLNIIHPRTSGLSSRLFPSGYPVCIPLLSGLENRDYVRRGTAAVTTIRKSWQ
jgi:hypothetical protein